MHNLFSSGVRTWLFQRLSALYVSVYFFVFIFVISSLYPVSYIKWLSFSSGFWFRLTTILFFISILYHSWVGLRDVVLDYAPNKIIKLIKLSILILVILMMLGGAFYIVYFI